jgi:hypothetical protein
VQSTEAGVKDVAVVHQANDVAVGLDDGARRDRECVEVGRVGRLRRLDHGASGQEEIVYYPASLLPRRRNIVGTGQRGALHPLDGRHRRSAQCGDEPCGHRPPWSR